METKTREGADQRELQQRLDQPQEARPPAVVAGDIPAKPADAPPTSTIAETYGVTDAEYAILRNTVCKDAPRAMAAFYMVYCRRRNMDPFAKQVYLMNVGGSDRPDWQIVTGIDGFRSIATRNPAYRGIDEPRWEYFTDDDGHPREFAADDSKYGRIAGKLRVDRCKVVVHRTPPGAPWNCPRDLWLDITGVIRFDEFVQKGRDGKIKGAWENAPENQSAIRAEAQAWRRAFPEDVGGLLTFEEADDIRARNVGDGEATATGTAAAFLTAAKPEEADPDPEDAEIEDLAPKIGWRTKAMVGSQLARFNGDKSQLLAHMRRELDRQADSARGRARAGQERQPEAFATNEPPPMDAEVRDDPEPVEAPSNPAYERAGSIEPGTRKNLFKLMNDVRAQAFPNGIKEKADRLRFARGNGVEIDSYTKISENQARALVDVLAAWKRGECDLLPPGMPACQRLRCDACGAKRGEPHVDECPIDETDEPDPTEGQA